MTYNPALDGIRAIAVLAVIAFHARVPGLLGGFIGVDIFFVLSGYLITRLLVEEHHSTGGIDCPRFYARRLARLAPALLLMLAVYLAAAPFAWPHIPMSRHFGDAALVAAYASDYTQALWELPRVLVHTWSLSVEMHFYLLWPLALMILLWLPQSLRLQALAGLYVAATAWRVYACMVATSFHEVYFRFDMRLSGLLLGAVLAMLHHRNLAATPRQLVQLGAVSAFSLAILIISAPWGTPVGLAVYVTAAEVATAGLIIVVAASHDTPIYRALSARPMVVIGILSYGLYLWHYPIAFTLRKVLPWYWTIGLTLPLAFMGAALSYVTIERLARRMRERLRRRPQGGAAATEAPSMVP